MCSERRRAASRWERPLGGTTGHMALTEQIADGVHRVADGIVNWYLVTDGDEVALYDAGWPRSWPRVQGALAELGRSPADVTAILLTHGHPDHLGAAEHARKACRAAVHVHEAEAPRARGVADGASPWALVPGLIPTLWRPSSLGFVLQATAKGFLFPNWPQDVTTFASGAQLDVPGRPRAVPTPGHTAGHVSFVLEDRGVVFAGDALATLDVLTREEGPRLMPARLDADHDQARRSLDALAGLDAGVLLPGHGEPFRGAPSAATARALAA